MELITKELEAQIPRFYTQEENEDPLAIVKLFTPDSNWTWYVIEYDPDAQLAFGYVVGLEQELGYFSIRELMGIRGPLGLRIERDLHWSPRALSQIQMEHHQ